MKVSAPQRAYFDKICEWLEKKPIIYSLKEFRENMVEYADGEMFMVSNTSRGY